MEIATPSTPVTNLLKILRMQVQYILLLAVLGCLDFLSPCRIQAHGVFEPVLLSRHSCWRFWDRGVHPGPGWYATEYDDFRWSSGSSEFGFGEGDEFTLIATGTSQTNPVTTVYFRTTFSLPPLFPVDSVRLQLKVDDGAIVYLNGQEIYRYNLPSAGVTEFTPAARALDDGQTFHSILLTNVALMPVDNLVAVEVHQEAELRDDLSFDLEIVAGGHSWGIGSDAARIPYFYWDPSLGERPVVEYKTDIVASVWTPLAAPAGRLVGEQYQLSSADLRSPFRLGPQAYFRLNFGSCLPPTVEFDRTSFFVRTNSELRIQARTVGANEVQWRKNEVFLEGPSARTESLLLPNLSRAEGGMYQLFVANGCGCSFSCPVVVVVGGISNVLADRFADRQTLQTYFGQVNGWNQHATLEVDEPRHPSFSPGRTLWMSWRAPTNGVVTFDTKGSAQQTSLAVYRGETVSSLQLEASSGPRTPEFLSEVEVNATAGTIYHIGVDGYGLSGSVCLNWSLAANAPLVPQIVLQPLTQSVLTESQVSFRVQARPAVHPNGNPLLYQWFRDGLPIPGAIEPTLTLVANELLSVGMYAAQVRLGDLVRGTEPAGLTVTSIRDGQRLGGATNLSSGHTSIPTGLFTGTSACGGAGFPYYRLFCFSGPATPPTTLTHFPPTPSYVDVNYYGPRPATGKNQLRIYTRLCDNVGLDTAMYLSALPTSGSTCLSTCTNANNSQVCSANNPNAQYLEDGITALCPTTTQVRVGIMYRPIVGVSLPSALLIEWEYLP